MPLRMRRKARVPVVSGSKVGGVNDLFIWNIFSRILFTEVCNVKKSHCKIVKHGEFFA